MQYEEALRLWGAKKIEHYYGDLGISIDPNTVHVIFNFSEGFACCGGSDPLCYCSLAESPRAEVCIEGYDWQGQFHSYQMDASSFDFASVLKEILGAAEGTISLEG